jgi:dihydrofolate reductase
MAKLIYITNVSLDGLIEDAQGNFDFTDPSDEVFAFITDLIRPVGTWLYGRRLYEAMAVWETDPTLAAASDLQRDFAGAWQAGEKIVYSTTLDAPLTERTTLERAFVPDVVRTLKAAATADLTIGGAELAAHAFENGLVDEVHLFVAPIALGTGKPALPLDHRIGLGLLDERPFDSGAVYLRYSVAS